MLTDREMCMRIMHKIFRYFNLMLFDVTDLLLRSEYLLFITDFNKQSNKQIFKNEIN